VNAQANHYNFRFDGEELEIHIFKCEETLNMNISNETLSNKHLTDFSLKHYYEQTSLDNLVPSRKNIFMPPLFVENTEIRVVFRKCCGSTESLEIFVGDLGKQSCDCSSNKNGN